MSWVPSIWSQPDSLPLPSSTSTSPLKPNTSSLLPPPTQASPYGWDTLVTQVRVTVLLDGNVDTFAPTYLAQGARGGRAAAYELRNKLIRWVNQREPEKSLQVLLMVKVFVNLNALFARFQSTSEAAHLPAFVQGFNSCSLPFSMADVGETAGAAEEAIKGHLAYLRPTSTYLLLSGGSPASSSGSLASDLMRLDHPSMHGKIMLVRHQPEGADRLLELGLEEVWVEGVFDGGKAVDNGLVPPLPADPFTTPSPLSSSLLSHLSSPVPTAGSLFSQHQRSLSLPAAPPHRPSPVPAGIAPIGTPRHTPSSSSFATASPAPSAFAFSVSHSRVPSSAVEDGAQAMAGLAANFAELKTADDRATVPQVPQTMAPSPPHIVRPQTSPPSVASASVVAATASPVSSPAQSTAASRSTKPAHQPQDSFTTTTTDFTPLLSLLAHLSRSSPFAPRRADVGQRLRNAYPELYENFGEYAREAERRGLVVLGKGEKVGGEWIMLAKEKGRERDRGQSPSRPRTRTHTSESSASPPDPQFAPLLSLLRTSALSGTLRPRRADIGKQLSRCNKGGKLYNTFSEYAREAERRGLVRLGEGEGMGREWIEIVTREIGDEVEGGKTSKDGTKTDEDEPVSLPESHVPTITLPAPNASETNFYPLLHLLLDLSLNASPPKPRPLRSFVGDRLRQENTKRGPGKWVFDAAAKEGLRGYLKEAEEGGLIRGGREGVIGGEWVELCEPEIAAALVASAEIPPPLAPQPRRPPSPSPSAIIAPSSNLPTIPARFIPLLQAISASDYPSPHWTSIGASLNKLKPSPPYEKGYFKEYVEEAREMGLIKTGKVYEKEGGWREGCYWMKMTPQAASVLSSITSTSKDTSPVSNPTLIPARFHPLIQTVLAQPTSAPHWTNIGAQLNKLRPRVYEEGEFKTYIKEAERAGVIRTGVVEGKAGCHWVKLTKRTPSTMSGSSAAPSHPFKPSAIPRRFLPLLRSILSQPYDKPYYSQVGVALSRLRPCPYDDSSMKEYVEEAVRMGLVIRGKGEKTGQDWIAVSSDLNLPNDLQTSQPSQPALPPPPTSSLAAFPPLASNSPAVLISDTLNPPTAAVSQTNSHPTPSLSLPSPFDLPISLSHPCPNPPSPSTPTTTEAGGLAPGGAFIASSILSHWSTLLSTPPIHPFAPLILSLNFLRTHSDSLTPSLSQLESMLELFPCEGGVEGVFELAGAGGEGLFGFVARAQRAGVVSVGEEGVGLREEWEGWGAQEGK
ncbi:hypothetical protein JCM11641_001575 [Rhodosporidiobolus odoratus]